MGIDFAWVTTRDQGLRFPMSQNRDMGHPATRSPLKIRGLGAILPSMAAARFVAVLSFVLATSLTAQNASTGQVVITVIDQAGAVLQGARIGIIQLPSATADDAGWLKYALHGAEQVTTLSNAHGEATVGLAQGSYAVSITSHGFNRHIERIEIRGDSNSQSLRATLVIDQTINPRVDCMSCFVLIPVESTSSDILIPLEPLQTITPTATRSENGSRGSE